MLIRKTRQTIIPAAMSLCLPMLASACHIARPFASREYLPGACTWKSVFTGNSDEESYPWKQWAATGLPLKTAAAYAAIRRNITGHEFSPKEALRWSRAGFSPTDAEVYAGGEGGQGLSLSGARLWRKNGVSAKNVWVLSYSGIIEYVGTARARLKAILRFKQLVANNCPDNKYTYALEGKSPGKIGLRNPPRLLTWSHAPTRSSFGSCAVAPISVVQIVNPHEALTVTQSSPDRPGNLVIFMNYKKAKPPQWNTPTTLS